MSTTRIRRGILLGLAIVATLSAASCTAGRAASSADHSHTAPPAATGTPNTAPGATNVQNLGVTPSVRDELQAAYVTYKHIPPSDIAGTAPNSVYYAYDPATKTYWAMATFEPSATASFNTRVEMQDGGNTGMFTKASDGVWQMRQASFPPGCDLPQFFPAGVIAVWALSTFCPPGHS